MANPLTGDFPAVVQLSVQQIHGLMAMMHQNRAEKHPGFDLPTFPHSERFHLTGPPLVDPFVVNFGRWLSLNRPTTTSGNPEETVNALVEKMPPGGAERVRGAFFQWATSTLDFSPHLSGIAEVQLGSPTVRVPDGSTSELTVCNVLRARFRKDPGTIGLPEFIHGKVEVTYTFERRGSTLYAHPPQDDRHIVFQPLNGISGSDLTAVVTQLRKLVRQQFKPSTISLPTEFPFIGFRAIGPPGDQQAITVPLSPDGTSPQGDLRSINAHLLNGKDFAFAVSRGYFDAKFAPMIAQIKALRKTIVVPLPVIPDASYILTVRNAWLEWKPGSIDLRISARATTAHVVGSVAGDFENIEVTQKLIPILHYGTLSVTGKDSDLTITGLDIPALDFFGINSPAYGPARAAVVEQRNQFLPQISQGLEKAFANHFAPPGALYRFLVVLRRFDGATTGEYKDIEVLPDGLILRGNIHSGKRATPAAIIQPTQHNQLSAHQSWIPGGSIERFKWSLFLKVPLHTAYGLPVMTHWNGRYAGFASQRDNFLFPAAAVPTHVASVCLTTYGKQFDSNGTLQEVDGSETYGGDCIYALDEPIYIAPDWDVFTIPKVHPYPPYHVRISDFIFGHVDMVREIRVRHDLMANHLVLFPRWELEHPLAYMHDVLANLKRQHFSLKVIAVVPHGALDITRQELEAKLGFEGLTFTEPGEAQRSIVHLELAEDIRHGWSLTFGTEPGSGAFLTTPAGGVAWGKPGHVEPSDITSALESHLAPIPEPRSNFHHPGLAIGSRLPDAEFHDDHGNWMRFSDFLGQELILIYWQSWSTPSLRELQRLQALQTAAGDSLTVIGICADSEFSSFEAIRAQYNLTLTLVFDEGRRLSRLAHIFFWPTIIRVSPGGTNHQTSHGSRPEERIHIPDPFPPPGDTILLP